MVAAQSPTIAKIKNEASESDARALLYIAICEVCDFFNVGKNMNDTQVAMTIDLIIEQYWYLKLEEIKYCFRRAMRTEVLFGRLDGNIILGWLQVYDNERTEEAMRISDQEATQQANQIIENPDAVSFEDYVASLRQRADSGDKEAKERLHDIDNPMPPKIRLLTAEEKHQKELEFFKFKLKHNQKK